MQCCGGALDRVGQRESSLEMAGASCCELQERDVDALVVVCPSCFQQFDLNQAALRRAGEEVDVPVLYLSELIALCFGHDARGDRPRHAPRFRPAASSTRWEDRDAARERARQAFDVRAARGVRQLRRLPDDCPVCKIDPEFQPNDIVRRILDGDLDTVLEDGQLWKCLECFTCLELCHVAYRPGRDAPHLKEHATAEGGQPERGAPGLRAIRQEGCWASPAKSARTQAGAAAAARERRRGLGAHARRRRRLEAAERETLASEEA